MSSESLSDGQYGVIVRCIIIDDLRDKTGQVLCEGGPFCQTTHKRGHPIDKSQDCAVLGGVGGIMLRTGKYIADDFNEQVFDEDTADTFVDFSTDKEQPPEREKRGCVDTVVKC